MLVIRYLDSDWTVRQVLTRLQVLSKSLTGDQLAGELIEAVSTTLQIDRSHLTATMRDSASINGAGIRVLKAVSIGCDVLCAHHRSSRNEVQLAHA